MLNDTKYTEHEVDLLTDLEKVCEYFEEGKEKDISPFLDVT
jgi:Asp-tRNA(Asn)/Glu-tRNA(Gln) amidotransferase C subunit